MWHPRRTFRSDAIAVATLLMTIALYFLPWICLRKVFFQVDIAFMDHPTRVHAFEMIRAGRFPFWTDHLLAGFPLFAEGQAAILYPFSWLYLLLPAEAALNAFIVLHFLILAVSTYVFLRSRDLTRLAALFGALTFVFSSFTLVEHVLPNFLAVTAWLPLLLWCTARFVETGRWRHAVGASGLIALMHVAGDPLGTLLAVALMTAFAAFCSRAGVQRAWRRRFAAILVPTLVGTLLAAVQLVPTLEFLQQSTRAAASPISSARLIPAEFLLTALSPNFFGASFAEYSGSTRQVWEESLFVFLGWAPLFLLPFGVRRRGEALPWLVIALAGPLLSSRALFSLNRHLWALPLFALFRWPPRIMLWYVLGTVMVASFGLDWLLQDVRALPLWPFARSYAFATGFGALGLTVCWVFRASFLQLGEPVVGYALSVARQWDAFLLAASWLLLSATTLLRYKQTIGPRVLAAVFLGVLAAGVVLNQRPEGVAPNVYRDEPTSSRFLKATYGPSLRLWAAAKWWFPAYPTDSASLLKAVASLPANSHLLHDLRAVGQFDLEATATLRRARALLAAPSPQILDLLAVDAVTSAQGPGDPLALEGTPLGPGARPARELLEGRYELCHSDLARVYCRSRRLSRAFLVGDYRVLDTPEDCARFVQTESPDLRMLALLERQPRWRDTDTAARCTIDRVGFLRDEPGLVDLAVEAVANKLLVLSDSYYPGWTATLDGQLAEILAADGLVRAVAIPAGRHRVVFRYDPRSFRWGFALSLTTLLAVFAVLVGAHLRSRMAARTQMGH
jgi:hypothetical protein